MPELPEVETTRRGVTPHIIGKQVAQVIVRERRLRWPVPAGLCGRLAGKTLQYVGRRAKYLLFDFDGASLIWHLGMSGSMRILQQGVAAGHHDHIDLVMKDGTTLRFRDPRRFGSVHYTTRQVLQHRLLRGLGPEPLSDALTGEYLYSMSRQRRQKVKTFIMDGRVVVGVGNIYASEALYGSGINPNRQAGRISLDRYSLLADAVKTVLQEAIRKGGTTLRDFVDSNGEPGYFRHELNVYDRAELPCPLCSTPIRMVRLGQRASYYCPRCQR